MSILIYLFEGMKHFENAAHLLLKFVLLYQTIVARDLPPLYDSLFTNKISCN